MAWMLYIDNDGGSELVRSELEQKCYLREPVDIIHCKDCEHGEKVNFVYLCGKSRGFGIAHEPDFFCADGERKE